MNLTSGDYWEYFWSWESENFAQGSGTTFDVEVGTFRLTLGSPAMIAGEQAYPISITGPTSDGLVDFAPGWTHLAAAADGSLLGSKNGATLEVIYDGSSRTWSGGGFFVDFPSDQEMTASTGTFPGVYNQVPAIIVGRQLSQGGCTYYPSVGQDICTGDPLSITEREYYKEGLGPVGYFFESRVTFTGGGFTTSHRNTRTVELIDASLLPTDGTTFNRPPWEEVAPLNIGRQDHAAAAYNGKIYVFGGWDGSTALSTVEIYDPATDSWSFGKSIPVTMVRPSATVIGNKIYVVPTFDSPVRIYDPVINDWSTGKNVPYNDMHGSCGMMNDYVVSATPDGALNATIFVYFYKVSEDNWYVTTNPLSATDQRWFSVACIGTDLYMVGGYLQFIRGNEVWGGLRRFDANATSDPWTILSGMNTARYSTASVTLNGEIVTLGGTDGTQELRTAEAYDPATNSWRDLPSMFRHRDDFAAVVLDGKIYVIGGDSGSNKLKNVEVYTPQ